MRVPPATSSAEMGNTLQSLCKQFGCDIELSQYGTDRVVCIAGRGEAVMRTCQELAVCLSEMGGEDKRRVDNLSSRTPPRSSFPAPGSSLARSSSPAPRRQPAVEVNYRQSAVDINFNTAVAAVRGRAGGMPAQSPSEAHLLKMLLSGPNPSQAQLRLVLPLAFVQQILVAQGEHARVAERSGSSIELGVEYYEEPAKQTITLTGQMLGNAMASLYIQELLAEYT